VIKKIVRSWLDEKLKEGAFDKVVLGAVINVFNNSRARESHSYHPYYEGGVIPMFEEIKKAIKEDFYKSADNMQHIIDRKFLRINDHFYSEEFLKEIVDRIKGLQLK
jgi:hypothetical protein